MVAWVLLDLHSLFFPSKKHMKYRYIWISCKSYMLVKAFEKSTLVDMLVRIMTSCEGLLKILSKRFLRPTLCFNDSYVRGVKRCFHFEHTNTCSRR